MSLRVIGYANGRRIVIDEGPAEHVTRLGGFIEAEPVGRMRPILVHGQTMTDTRRESAKRASRRYRARVR